MSLVPSYTSKEYYNISLEQQYKSDEKKSYIESYMSDADRYHVKDLDNEDKEFLKNYNFTDDDFKNDDTYRRALQNEYLNAEKEESYWLNEVIKCEDAQGIESVNLSTLNKKYEGDIFTDNNENATVLSSLNVDGSNPKKSPNEISVVTDKVNNENNTSSESISPIKINIDDIINESNNNLINGNIINNNLSSNPYDETGVNEPINVSVDKDGNINVTGEILFYPLSTSYSAGILEVKDDDDIEYINEKSRNVFSRKSEELEDIERKIANNQYIQVEQDIINYYKDRKNPQNYEKYNKLFSRMFNRVSLNISPINKTKVTNSKESAGLPTDYEVTDSGKRTYRNPDNDDYVDIDTFGDTHVNRKRLEYILGSNPNGLLRRNFEKTNGIIFPYTPSIDMSFKADYESTSLLHSNLAINQYKNSPPSSIDIQADFTADTEENAEYMYAVLIFLRAMTKTDFGINAKRRDAAGMPPPVLYLNGWSKMIDNIPVIVTSVNQNLPKDKHYVHLTRNNLNVWLPTSMTLHISLNIQPNLEEYRDIFDLDAYKNNVLGQVYKRENDAYLIAVADQKGVREDIVTEQVKKIEKKEKIVKGVLPFDLDSRKTHEYVTTITEEEKSKWSDISRKVYGIVNTTKFTKYNGSGWTW